MSKKDKALDRIRNNPKNVRFEELQRILESLGFELRHRSGSHAVFILGKYVLNIPYRRPFLKVVYVQVALAAIEEILTSSDETDEK